ncbi:MFS transporter [Geothrix sp. PMB-07]|uniref:spinster family MFS transporter n=1 Tax=Geothrix sp. PMB-07 TaxID=3068640 RepID=UPI00274191CA|nr:MFS transporter [Geothrix sp. PMB-07]WLT30866.1 MFS transporter [Geothrix sp. PMB-07]
MTAARRLLLLLTGINLVNYLDRYVVAAVLEPLGKELHLTDAQLGRLTLVFILVYMCSAPLFGYLADRFHRPRLVAGGVALWSLATVGAAFIHSYSALLIMRSLVGVGEAAYATLGPAMMADGFPEAERAKKFTWFYLAIPVGSAFGYGLGGLVAGAWGWRASFLVAGLPGLAFAAWMAFQLDPVRGGMDADVDTDASLPYIKRLRHVFFNRIWLACTASYVAYTFAMGALSMWGPTLLQRRFAVSTAKAGLVFGALAVITGILGTFLGGWLTDRWQKRWPDAGVGISGLTLLAATPMVALALGAGSLGAVYALFFAGMLLLFVNTSPVNALTVSCLPASVRATGVGLNVLLIHLLGDAISPELVGRRADALHASGLAGGEALGRAMAMVLPAILISGLALWWARHRRSAEAKPGQA